MPRPALRKKPFLVRQIQQLIRVPNYASRRGIAIAAEKISNAALPFLDRIPEAH
jgi:hypothetical protein